MHLGHRKSIDIDLFSINDFDVESTLQNLEQDFKFEMSQMESNTLRGSISGERIKDFIDLYFLLKIYTFAEIVSFYQKKYKSRNAIHAIKALIYFEDVDVSEWPDMIKETDLQWENVKNSIEIECNKYIKDLLKQS